MVDTGRTPSLQQVVAALEERYDPATAEDWDRVGLVCGDPEAAVRRVVFAVDPVDSVVSEALDWGAQLLVTHHPLLLRGVHSVAADTSKGRRVHRLIAGGCGLLAMHTNADSADPGVNDALADLLGLTDVVPLRPIPDQVWDKWTVHVPAQDREALAEAFFAAGAGASGPYSRAAYWQSARGQYQPERGARSGAGGVGQIELVTSDRLELVAPRSLRGPLTSVLRRQHPYEEPAYDVVEMIAEPGRRGIGRLGQLRQPINVRSFAERVEQILPATAHGVRVAGGLERQVRSVALCGGAGDSLLSDVRRLGADVYLTADLRHHPVEEHLSEGGCPLVDVAHWASEWPWLEGAASTLVSDLAVAGLTVETRVSTRPTDPWSLHLGEPA